MEFLALAVFLAVFAIVLALLSGRPISWLRTEWRLLRADTWASGQISGPTLAEKKVKRLEMRQRAKAKRMRKKGQHLCGLKGSPGKAYRPTLTSPTNTPVATAPKADRVVVPIRKQR